LLCWQGNAKTSFCADPLSQIALESLLSASVIATLPADTMQRLLTASRPFLPAVQRASGAAELHRAGEQASTSPGRRSCGLCVPLQRLNPRGLGRRLQQGGA